MQLECDQVVPRPIERVFAFLADPRNRPRWQSSLSAVEMLSDGEPRVGMRWRERPGGLVPFDMQISAYEPNQLWAEQLHGAGIAGQISLRFAAEGGGTKIHVSVTLNLPKPLELASSLLRPLIEATVRRDLASIEHLL